MKKHILEGKTIIDVKIADDKKAIKFITDEGDIIAKCDGDCCSETWIESVELPAGGFPALVISVEDIELKSEEKDCETIQFYGLKISTDKGDLVIDYRNASNGYYGGNLNWPDDTYYYGGVCGQNVSAQQWIDIKSC